jgi:hypothetical protein
LTSDYFGPLATGGKCIITSAPTSWTEEFVCIDLGKVPDKCIDDFGNETEVGVNGFQGVPQQVAGAS